MSDSPNPLAERRSALETTPNTALTPLLEKATGGEWTDHEAQYNRGSHFHSTEQHEHFAEFTAPLGGMAARKKRQANAALITASVRSIRWAHSEAGVEAIARLIEPDVFDPDVREDDYDDIDQYRAHVIAKARSIVAALAKAGVGDAE